MVGESWLGVSHGNLGCDKGLGPGWLTFGMDTGFFVQFCDGQALILGMLTFGLVPSGNMMGVKIIWTFVLDG